MSNSITISFGPGNAVEKPLADFPDLSAITRNNVLRSFLGFPENVEARVNGVVVSSFRAGDKVELVTKANEKGC